MVEFKCWVKDCDFVTSNNPHVDACINSLQEHFRGVHPRTYLNVADTGNNITRYNWTWEEYVTAQLGNDWANFRGDTRYYAQQVIRQGINVYCQSTIDGAQAWLDANPEAADEGDGGPFEEGQEDDLADIGFDLLPQAQGADVYAQPGGILLDVAIPIENPEA